MIGLHVTRPKKKKSLSLLQSSSSTSRGHSSAFCLSLLGQSVYSGFNAHEEGCASQAQNICDFEEVACHPQNRTLLSLLMLRDIISQRKTIRLATVPTRSSACVAHRRVQRCYTKVISTSSVFSACLRGCCVGGGGAARTGRSLPRALSGVNRGS